MPGNSRSNSRSNSNTTGAGGQGRDESRGGRVSKQVGSSRKRSQNRIAQQCLRERRAAHDRHVGQVMKTLDSASEAGQSRRYDTLLESHLKLARHCQLLEDALFDLRKKLLGLSNSASMAADNSVFDLILGRIDQTDSPHVSSTDITPTFERTDATGDATQKGQETQGTQETCAGTGIDDVALWPGPGADASNDMFGDFSSVPLVSAPHAFHPRAISRDANVHMGPHLQPDTFATDWTSSLFATSDSFTLVDASAERSDPSADPSADPSTRRRDVGMPQSYVGCPWDILARPTSQKISIQSCSTFNNTVLRAAMRCVPRVHVLPGLLHLNTEQVAQQVSVAAVNLIITASGMQHYSYGIVSLHPPFPGRDPVMLMHRLPRRTQLPTWREYCIGVSVAEPPMSCLILSAQQRCNPTSACLISSLTSCAGPRSVIRSFAPAVRWISTNCVAASCSIQLLRFPSIRSPSTYPSTSEDAPSLVASPKETFMLSRPRHHL